MFDSTSSPCYRIWDQQGTALDEMVTSQFHNALLQVKEHRSYNYGNEMTRIEEGI